VIKHVIDMPVPNSKSGQLNGEREKLKRLVARRNLCGLANDTKWDELINAMRARDRDWTPRFRFKCIDGPPSGWDSEWFYHLPFPMLSAEWLDISCTQEITNNRLPRCTQIIDHSRWIVEILDKAGLDYQTGKTMIRVFGYSPKDQTLFDRGQ
jgi:hypothetical protein